MVSNDIPSRQQLNWFLNEINITTSSWDQLFWKIKCGIEESNWWQPWTGVKYIWKATISDMIAKPAGKGE